MSQPFPPIPYLSGNFAPILMECEAADLPVQGALPPELAGTFYRNGPNPQYAPRDEHHHWFAGDGMIHAFDIGAGRVSYRNRWVRTEKFRLERAAGRSLFGTFGNPMTSDPSVAGKVIDGLANTNILWHGDRLLALEEAHLPVALDWRSLETLGPCSFDGKLTSRMTAHPKIDPRTGELVFFAYSAGGWFSATMLYGTVDAAGQLTRLDRFEAPFASMVHDFMVTDRHVLFPILPLTGSMARAMSGQPPFAWEPDKGAHIGIMRRDGGTAEMRWFKGEACYVFHPMNAWEEGDRIIAEVMQFERAPLFPDVDGRHGDPAETKARLCRWTFDLAGNSDTFTREYVDDLSGEFPRIDDRRAGLSYRHGWYAAQLAPEDRFSFDALVHLDRRSGARHVYRLPPGDAVSEPVFVPRTAAAEEGDGFALAVAWRGAEKRSDLLVFEAEALAQGPVATVQLSHRVPFGFHGNWRPAAIS
jgi:carotenoid cleavage dioxygenase-like enzyme